MKLACSVIAVLVLLNATLFVSNWVLVRSLRVVGTRGTKEEIAALRRERERLSIERGRLEARLDALSGLTQKLSAALAESVASQTSGLSQTEVASSSSGAAAFEVDGLFREASLVTGLDRPRPASIPLLTEDERADLASRRRRMPERLDDGVLLSGDVDAVLSDPEWNPGQRTLSEAERAELSAVLSHYRYFARLSLAERYYTMVAPEIPRLREAGAYLEYDEGEAPPVADRACTSHAEPSDTPGINRIYYFFPDDHPALAHHKRVEEERALECFVRAYEIINGGSLPEPAPRGPETGERGEEGWR